MSFVRIFEQFIETIGTFWPIFSVLYLLVSSLFNNSIIKGLFYFTGLIIIWIFWQIYLWIKSLKRLKGETTSINNSFIYSITSLNFLNVISSINVNDINVSFSPMAVWFTNLYIFFTMIYSSVRKPVPNASFIALIIAGTLSNIYSLFKQNMKTDTAFSIIYFGLSVIGVLWGILWFSLSNINPKLLMFSDILYQNSQLCNLNKNKNFTCQFYKDGLPLKND